jgi:hypothetical protein
VTIGKAPSGVIPPKRELRKELSFIFGPNWLLNCFPLTKTAQKVGGGMRDFENRKYCFWETGFKMAELMGNFLVLVSEYAYAHNNTGFKQKQII